MRTMYDSTTAADIPRSAAMVAGYAAADPSFAWSPADWALFPRAVRVVIATRATVFGLGIHVLDVETGDATPAEAPGWAHTQRALGQIPSIYCNAGTWPAVQAAFAAAHEPPPYYWIAAYPVGGPVIPAGAIAHQYADPGTSGGHYDLSAVADYWPGVDPAPDPPAPGDDMIETHWVVDMANGVATCAFEVGIGPLSPTSAYIGVKAVYGDIPGAVLFAADDNGNGLAIPGWSGPVDLLANRRHAFQLPKGASDITIEWDPTKVRHTGSKPLALLPYLITN